MSIAQLVPIKVVLAPGATPQASFGISTIFGFLTSAQYAAFVAASGGSSALAIAPQGLTQTLEDLGLVPGDRLYEDAVSHFQGDRVPSIAYLSYRGVADQTHIQAVQILPEAGTTDKASVGAYKLLDIEGGPYTYISPGLAQVVTLEVADAGGGNGAPGVYRVEDGNGIVSTYNSGGFNVWTSVITVAAAGLYTVTVSGVTDSYTASGGDSIEDIRDGLFADMLNTVAHPGGHPDWTGNTSGTDSITITGNVVGETLVVTSNLGPTGSEATIAETAPIVPEAVGVIAAGIDAAMFAGPVVPANYTTVVAAGVITVTASAGFEGTDLGILGTGPTAGALVFAQTTDWREDVVTVRDALTVALGAASHPSFTNADSGTDSIVLTGTVAGDYVEVAVEAPNDNIVLSETQDIITLRTAQTSRVSVATNPADSFAYVGTYTLTLFGIMVSYVAGAGESAEDVRDALQASVDANIPQVTTSAVGTDALDLTSNTAGQPFGVTQTSPNGDAALTVTIPAAGYSIRNDILRAIQDAPESYIFLNSGTQVDIEVATATMDEIGADFPRMHYWQHADPAMLGPIAGATDVGANTEATQTMRSKGVWNPEPVTSAATAKAYEGAASQWVGSFTTLLPGQIQPTGKRQRLFTSRNQLPIAQEKNLEARAVQYMEWVPTLGATGSQVMQRRFTPSGRLIDLQRALDQIQSVYQGLALDLITSMPIIPYTNPGIGIVHNSVVVEGTNLLKTQGLVISTEAAYVNGRLPRVSDATKDERDAGILPVFEFSITIQLGATEIPITVNVSQ
jgi:hypothetical protein